MEPGGQQGELPQRRALCPRESPTDPARTLSRREASAAGPNRGRCVLRLLQKTHQPAAQPVRNRLTLTPLFSNGLGFKTTLRTSSLLTTEPCSSALCVVLAGGLPQLAVPDCHSPPFLNQSIFFFWQKNCFIFKVNR